MPKSGSPFEFRDWAHLPPEIVELISVKVKYIVDYVRFRAVCSPWRSASLPKPRHLPPQLPWLLLPYTAYMRIKNGETRFFYDVWESKIRKLHLPESLLGMCSASYRGWFFLVSYKGREVSLLNPLTRSKIDLPPFSTWFDPYMISFGKSKITFSSDLSDPNCLIIVFLEEYWVLSCRVGDRCWKRFYIRQLADLTCYNGRLYVLYEREMEIVEMNKLESMPIILVPELTVVLEPDLAAVSKRFVEGKSGVYVVGIHPEEKFELYQFQEQQMKLKKVTTDVSNNTAIFYGDNYPCLALSSDDWDSLKPGSLYMEHNCVPYAWKYAAKSGRGIQSAQLATKNVLSVDDKYPRFRHVEPAMWFQPSYF